MQIIEDVQMDYSDVLIKPRRSTIVSRKDADITRDYKYKTPNGIRTIRGTGIMQANMGTIGNFEVSKKLLEKGLFACLHKHHSINNLVKFYSSLPSEWFERCFISIGLRDKLDGYNKLDAIIEECGACPPICIDVPNGYIPQVKQLVIDARNRYEDAFIMVGNVVTGDITEDLILSGANAVKVGIGGGCQCLLGDTMVHTKNGLKKMKEIQEGDEVLTHNGNYKKVLTKLCYTFHNEKININGVECTPEHKFLVINKSDKDNVNEENLMEYAYWVEACNLDEEKQLIVKRK